jgi:thioredoxin reductase
MSVSARDAGQPARTAVIGAGAAGATAAITVGGGMIDDAVAVDARREPGKAAAHQPARQDP